MKNKRGAILILVLIFLIVAISIGVSLTSLVIRGLKSTQQTFDQHLACEAAEAGIERAMWNINNGDDNDVALQKVDDAINSEYEVTVDDSVANMRILAATGYSPSKTATNKKTKSIKVTAVTGGVGIAFRYAVQTGDLGLVMNGNSTINGNIYSNGSVLGYSNSRINGDAWADTTISSPDPTVTGTKHPDEEDEVLPNIDYNYWETKATEGGTIGTLTIDSGPQSLGPKKIDGNLTLNSNSSLTVTGPLYVTGNFSMNSNTHLYIDSSFGSSGTLIVVEGQIAINSNSIIHHTGTNPKGYILLASKSTSTSAISLNSNANGGIFYALNGNVEINANAHVVAVVGKKLTLNSNATLDYDAGLPNAKFTSGPSGGWAVKSWQLL